MKKIICVMLAVLTVLCFMPAASYAADIYTVSYIFNKTFDAEATGSQPSESNTNGNILRIEDYPSAQDKSVYFESVNGVSAFINSSVYTSDCIIAEFDIMYLDADNANLSLHGYNLARDRISPLIYITDKGYLHSCDGKKIAYIGTKKSFTTISVALDIRTGKVSVYADGKKRAIELDSVFKEYTDIGEIRLNIGNGKGYINNFAVYIGDIPIKTAELNGLSVRKGALSGNSDSELAEYMEDSYSFFSGGYKYYHSGRTLMRDEVIYVSENGKGYLSGDFARNILGAELDGERIEITEAASKIGKRAYVGSDGVAIISDRDVFFNMSTDIPLYRKLLTKICFNTPDSGEMINILRTRYADHEHPRIFRNAQWYKDILKTAETDEILNKSVSNIISSSEKSLDVALTFPKDSSGTILPSARALKASAKALGAAYRMTGDTRYAAKLWEYMETVCKLNNWDDWHFLSTGEFLFGMGVGFDYIYDYLSEEQRQTVVKNIVEKGLKEAFRDYEDDLTRYRSFKWVQDAQPSNWKTVCNTGVLISALSIWEYEPEIAKKAIDYSMENIKQSIIGYAPDGAWFEGPTYWMYNTEFYTYFINALDNMFGTDFGYFNVPGIDKTVSYMIALQGDNGAFNYGDASHVSYTDSSFLLFSNKLENPSVQNYLLNNYSGAVNIFNYRPDFDRNASLEIPLDVYARDSETVLMHSGYEPHSIFTGLHSGVVLSNHTQYDSGTVVIDAYGDDFVYDLGSTDYSHWPQTYLYRKRTEGHNLFVINPDFNPGQDSRAFTTINRFEHNDVSAFAITDLTAAYQRDAVSALRGLMLTDNREKIILQDEIKLREKGEIYWFLHSKCPITVSKDGKTAIFHGTYKDMKATLFCNCDGVFTVEAAKGIEGKSPVPSRDIDDSKFNKLSLHLDNIDSASVTVLFTFEWQGMDTPVAYTPMPLSEWSLSDDAAGAAKPKLTDISANGKTISGFDPKSKMYKLYYDADGEMPVITAKGGADIEIKYPDTPSGNVYITVKGENGVSETYCVKLIAQKLATLNNGSQQFFIYSIEASDIPQPENGPENVLDGDINTRYSAEGTPYLTMDIGEEKTLTDVAVAVWQGDNMDGRKQTFRISVSNDGVNFDDVFTGTTSGTTLEKEYYEIPPSKCRYIRITGAAVNGSPGGWNSFTEVTFFGK